MVAARQRRSVVLDPLSFGAPITGSSGIPTAALVLAAARWYPPATEREVRDAIAFERRLLGSPARRIAA
jgi:hypothetical protein